MHVAGLCRHGLQVIAERGARGIAGDGRRQVELILRAPDQLLAEV
jgi:hypothetical protein